MAEIRLSPAQILFHCQLLNDLPTNLIHEHLHSNWVISATERENHCSHHTQRVINDYNNQLHVLKPLPIQFHILI